LAKPQADAARAAESTGGETGRGRVRSEMPRTVGDSLPNRQPQNEKERLVWDWLRELNMLEYFEKICEHFECDFAQISACKLRKGPCWFDRVDIAFFEALDVKKTGHKMLLASAIHRLSTENGAR
jgi:hypothetical protein